MERIECVVIGAGVVGLALARELALAGREVVGPGGRGPVRHRHQLPQQRSDPRRHVLPSRLPQGPALRGGQPGPVRVLPGPAGGAPALRQAHRGRRARPAGGPATGSRPRPTPTASRTCDWLTGARPWPWSPGSTASAALLSPSTGIVDSHGLMQALLRDAEEPRRRRGASAARSLGGGPARRRAGAGGGRRRAHARPGRAACSTAPGCRPARWPGPSGAAPPTRPARPLRQGQLLLPDRRRALLPAGLPGARRRPGWACT